MFRSGMFTFNWKLSKEGKKRFFDEFLPLLHDTKHEVLDKDEERSWYLVYIGTKADSRGKGYAKALIEDTTKQASRLPSTAPQPFFMSLKQERLRAYKLRKSIEALMLTGELIRLTSRTASPTSNAATRSTSSSITDLGST